MATTTNNDVHISEREHVREFYQEKKGLFGLITYRVVQRREQIGKEVSIHIPGLRLIDGVFINGNRVLGEPN